MYKLFLVLVSFYVSACSSGVDNLRPVQTYNFMLDTCSGEMISEVYNPKMPKVWCISPAEYPLSALKEKVEGYVLLQFDVKPDGSLENIVVLDASPKGYFERSAIESMGRSFYHRSTNGYKKATRKLYFKMAPNS